MPCPAWLQWGALQAAALLRHVRSHLLLVSDSRHLCILLLVNKATVLAEWQGDGTLPPHCSECVIDTLEGPGIAKSQCPSCQQPGWKKDLVPNYTVNNSVEHVQQLMAGIGAGGWAGGVGDYVAGQTMCS